MNRSFLSRPLSGLALAALLLSPMSAALADDDIKGKIESINTQNRSFVVNGEAFYVDDRTDYDDDYKRFEDLKVGDRVEVDFRNDNGRKVATEIERDS